MGRLGPRFIQFPYSISWEISFAWSVRAPMSSIMAHMGMPRYIPISMICVTLLLYSAHLHIE